MLRALPLLLAAAAIAAADPLLLWPNGLPDTPIDPAGAGKPTAKEIPRLVPFLLEGVTEPRPLVVVCPGGGYSTRAKHEGEPVARWLNGLGMHAAVVEYRVWPWRYPAPQMDARQAIRLVRANAERWRVDPAKVGILGFSAGGHLATSTATLHARTDIDAPGSDTKIPGRPDALVACYAVISASERGHRWSFNRLIGEPFPPALVEFLSLERSVDKTTPPTFIWHTADDAAVPVDNAQLLSDALKRAEVPVELHIFPNGKHGLGLAEGTPCAAWTARCADWFRGMGWIAKQ